MSGVVILLLTIGARICDIKECTRKRDVFGQCETRTTEGIISMKKGIAEGIDRRCPYLSAPASTVPKQGKHREGQQKQKKHGK
jgi:hypothetical protein